MSLILTRLIWLKSAFPKWDWMGKSFISLEAVLCLNALKPVQTCALCSIGCLTRDCGYSYCRHFRNISIAAGYPFTDWNSSKWEMSQTHLVQFSLVHSTRCSWWSCWASPPAVLVASVTLFPFSAATSRIRSRIQHSLFWAMQHIMEPCSQ